MLWSIWDTSLESHRPSWRWELNNSEFLERAESNYLQDIGVVAPAAGEFPHEMRLAGAKASRTAVEVAVISETSLLFLVSNLIGNTLIVSQVAHHSFKVEPQSDALDLGIVDQNAADRMPARFRFLSCESAGPYIPAQGPLTRAPYPLAVHR